MNTEERITCLEAEVAALTKGLLLALYYIRSDHDDSCEREEIDGAIEDIKAA